MRSSLRNVVFFLIVSFFYTDVCHALDEKLQKHLESTDFHTEVIVGFPLVKDFYQQFEYYDKYALENLYDPRNPLNGADTLEKKADLLGTDLIKAKILFEAGYLFEGSRLRLIPSKGLSEAQSEQFARPAFIRYHHGVRVDQFPGEDDTATYFLIQINSKDQAERLEKVLDVHTPTLYKASIAKSSVWAKANQELEKLKKQPCEFTQCLESLGKIENAEEALRQLQN